MEYHYEKRQQFDGVGRRASGIGREFRLKRDLMTHFAE
jgi:hypothetical protein